MIRITTAVLALLVIAATPASGADGDPAPPLAIEGTIDSLVVAGPNREADEMARTLLLSQPGVPLNEGLIGRDTDTLADWFRREGWWNTTVGADAVRLPDGRLLLTFRVETGPRVLFGTVSAVDSGNVPLTSPIAPLPSGEPFTDRILTGMIDTLTGRYAAEGYPDVAVVPRLAARGDTVDVTFVVTAGARAMIDSLLVTGLVRTRETTILRELRDLPGKPAGQAAVAEATARLGKLAYVRQAAPPRIGYSDDGRAILILDLTEGDQGSFEGIAGYQPGTDGGKGEFVGAVHLSFLNLLGTGRSAAVRWDNLGGDSEDLNLSYREPWMFGRPWGLETGFAQERRDAYGYTRTIFNAAIDRDAGALRGGIGYRYEKISADSTDSASAHGADLTAVWDGIDDPAAPSRGIRYALRWSQLRKQYRFNGGSHTLDRLELDLDHFIPTRTGQTLAVLIRYRRVDVPAGRITPADRYWLGGSDSIRGYRERIFPAVNATWMSLEYRFMQERGSWFFVFADTGYLVNRSPVPDGTDTRSARTLFGYGAGVRIASRAGRLGFDLGLGRGDGIADAKLHIRLISGF